MKNRVFIGLLALVAVCLVSCNNTQPCNFHKETFNITVLHDDWGFDPETQQFFYRAEDNILREALNATVYNVGNWSLSREFNAETADAYQVTLPTSEFAIDTLWNDAHDAYDLHYYSRYIDYRVGVGYVDVQVMYSDFCYPKDDKDNPIKPEDMLFRLQLMY